jgi:hypothetical protein
MIHRIHRNSVTPMPRSRVVLAWSLFAAATCGVAIACSGDDNGSNPTPTINDSGTSDVTTSGDDSSTGTDSSTASDTGTTDAPSLDTGSCKSDASTCNTCYTAAQAAADPYNACSQYTANCVSFDPTRVPTHPQI